MTVRGKLSGLCVCVAAIQLVAAAGQSWFSRRAARHHAGTRGAHEQLELLVRIEAGLVWQLKEVGDLVPQRGLTAEKLNVGELIAAQARVDAALEGYAERAGQERESRDLDDVDQELGSHAALATIVSDVRAGVTALGGMIERGSVEREIERSQLEARIGRAVDHLQRMVQSEQAEVAEQEEAAARAGGWASRVAWSAPLLSGLVLVTALVLLLRSIYRPLSDLARGAVRVAGGDLEQPVPVRSHDELGGLAAAFNDMQRDLQRHIEQRDHALRDARFRVVSEAAPVAIAEVDGAGHALYVNRRWFEMTGSGPGSAPWTELLHADDRVRATRLQFDADGTPEEVRVVRGDDAVWAVARMAPLEGDSGRYIVALADITAQKVAIDRAEQLSRELVAVSRKAGMAETSAGVLHNVGNVLSSVIVSTSMLGDQLRRSRVSGLVKATAMLEERRDDLAGFLSTDRGKLVVPYLVQVAAQLVEDNAAARAELERIEKGVEHIRAVVTSQQSYARAGAVAEEVRLSEIVDDVLRLHSTRFDRHEVTLTRRFDADPALVTDRHKAMQILLNLIGNALHALAEAGASGAGPELTISTRMTADGRLAVDVADNGIGIAPENMARIFEYGFTTRKSGHGFGLHSSVRAAQELGGCLRVASEGPGRGATFTLELPVAAERAAARSA